MTYLDQLKDAVAQQVIAELERQELTQADLAERLEVTAARVSHMLQGHGRNLTLRTLERMADALECRIELHLVRE